MTLGRLLLSFMRTFVYKLTLDLVYFIPTLKNSPINFFWFVLADIKRFLYLTKFILDAGQDP